MKKSILLGIDIGTSSCKVAAFNPDGTIIDHESIEYKVYYPKKGWAEQDPDEWWSAVCEALKIMFSRKLVDPKYISGIGVDGQSWSAIPLDNTGKVLSKTPIWMDTRSEEICEEFNQKIGKEKIFDISGNRLEPTYTLPKILWFKKYRPEIFSMTDKFLQSNSFIVYRLTNKMSQDLSQCYGLQCFDLKKGEYNKEICEAMGISLDLFPEVFSCHSIVGTVSKEAALVSGLVEGIPVVAGGLDAACGALGAGVINPGETQEQGGQAGGMSICLDQYKADPRLILGYHVVPNRWLLQGGTVGGAGVAKWFLNNLGYEEQEKAKVNQTNSFYEMDVLADQIKPGSEGLVFLPYMAGERSPIWNSKAKGVYFGIDFSKTKAHFIRANHEGVAFSLKHNLEIASDAGAEVTELHAVGGAANSLLWTQIKSDITGKKIVIPSSDTATTLGAAILAGVGVGIYKDFEEAVMKTVKIQREHNPQKNQDTSVYQKNYKIYKELYHQLEETMNKFS